MIGDFVQDHIQNQMKEVYGLKEIMIPEDDQMSEKDTSSAKNNIFMSHQFYRPDDA